MSVKQVRSDGVLGILVRGLMAALDESNFRLSWGSPTVMKHSCCGVLHELDILNLDEQNEAKRT
jgi:hypothetical protein